MLNKNSIDIENTDGLNYVKNPQTKVWGVFWFLSTQDLRLLSHELKQGVYANSKSCCIKVLNYT